MKPSPKGYRRKDLFSNPGAQRKIVLVFAVLAILFAATHYHVARRVLNDLDHCVTRLPLSMENQSDMAVILEQQAQMLDLQLAILTFLAVSALLMGGVLLSHRIGGPIYQLRKYLEDMAAGTVQPRRIRFRKYDFFHDLADSFNKFQQSKGILKDEVSQPAANRDAGSRPGNGSGTPSCA